MQPFKHAASMKSMIRGQNRAQILCKSFGQWSLRQASTPSWFQQIIDSNRAGWIQWLVETSLESRLGVDSTLPNFCIRFELRTKMHIRNCTFKSMLARCDRAQQEVWIERKSVQFLFILSLSQNYVSVSALLSFFRRCSIVAEIWYGIAARRRSMWNLIPVNHILHTSNL